MRTYKAINCNRHRLPVIHNVLHRIRPVGRVAIDNDVDDAEIFNHKTVLNR